MDMKITQKRFYELLVKSQGSNALPVLINDAPTDYLLFAWGQLSTESGLPQEIAPTLFARDEDLDLPTAVRMIIDIHTNIDNGGMIREAALRGLGARNDVPTMEQIKNAAG